MLQYMRTGAKSIIVKVVLFGFLAMAMFGLVFMDVQGVFRGGVGGSVVAKVAGDKISTAEFDNIVRRSLAQSGMNADEAYQAGMINQILNQEIQHRLASHAAQNLGLYISNDAAADEVKKLLTPLTSQGLTDQQALEHVLRQQNIPEAQFSAMVKSQIASEKLLMAVLTGSFAPDQMVQDFYRFQNEQRIAQFIAVTPQDIEPIQPPSEEELVIFYNKMKGFYHNPEYRALDIVVLKSNMVMNADELSEEQLRAEYNERKSEFEILEQRKVEQVVVPNRETAMLIQQAAAKNKKKDLKKAVESVTGNTDAYLEPELYTVNDMIKELADAAFQLEPNTISSPVETSLGWHVLRAQEIKDGKTRSFDDVKETLRSEVLKDLSVDILFDTSNAFEDLLAGGTPLEDAAKELGFPIITTQPLTAETLDQNGEKVELLVPLYDQIIETAFSLPEGESSSAIESPEGEYVFVSVKNIIPAAAKPLEEIKDELVQRWVKNKQSIAMEIKAKDIVADIKKGTPFEQATKNLKNKVKRTPPLSRSTQPDDTLPQGILPATFNLNKTGDAASFFSGTEQIIVGVSDIILADPTEEDADLDILRTVLQRSVRDDISEQFRNGLIRNFGVDVNDRLIMRMYGPEENL